MTHLEGGPAAHNRPTISAAERAILRAALGLREGAAPLPRLDSHTRKHYVPSPADVPTCEAMRSYGLLAVARRIEPYAAAVRACYIVTDAGYAALLAAEAA